MATFRGSDGVLTLATNPLANMQSFEFTLERDWLDTTALGDTAETGTLDIEKGNGRFTCQLDYDDTPQAAALDILLAGTSGASALAAVFQMAAGKTFTGNILPLSATVRSQKGSLVTVDVAFRFTGGTASAWS